MVYIDKTYLRTLLANAFKIPEDQVINPSLCIPIGKSVKMYSDAIERGAIRGMHLLFCRNYEKINNQWIYELENAVGIWVGPQFLKDIIMKYSVSNQQLPTGMIAIDLQSIFDLPDQAPVLLSNSEPEPIESKDVSVIETVTSIIPEDLNFDIEYDTDMDRSADKFLRREYAAILLKVPASGTKWLDEMINLSNKLNNR